LFHKDECTTGRQKNREVEMTTAEKLLLQKQQLLERLQADPGPNERIQIEGILAQIDEALDLLEEPGETEF